MRESRPDGRYHEKKYKRSFSMNLPNKLTLLRICMIPVFIVAYFLPYTWTPWVAAGIFVLAAFTDFLDGRIARKYNLVTDFGKLLDPVADKILVASALFCLAATNPFQWLGLIDMSSSGLTDVAGYVLIVGCIVILARELLVDGVRMVAASKGMVIQANIFGKIKTILQDVSIPLMILLGLGKGIYAYAESSDSVYEVPIGYAVLWYGAFALFAAAVAMTIISGVIYLVQNKSVFEDR